MRCNNIFTIQNAFSQVPFKNISKLEKQTNNSHTLNQGYPIVLKIPFNDQLRKPQRDITFPISTFFRAP